MTMHSVLAIGAVLAAATILPATAEPDWLSRYQGADGASGGGSNGYLFSGASDNNSGGGDQGDDWGSDGQAEPTPPPQPQPTPPPQPPANPPPNPPSEPESPPSPPPPPPPPQEEQEPEEEEPQEDPEPQLRQAEETVEQSFGGVDEDEDNGDNGGADMDSTGSGSVSSGSNEGHGTHFAGMGHSGPISACGVPTEMYVDDDGTELPFVALNTNSEFKDGANCGRWLEVKLGRNCEGGGNSGDNPCTGSYNNDEFTGEVTHFYVSDMCPDKNWWCQSDPYHLDLSEPFLEKMGWLSTWNGRLLNWAYMNGAPDGYTMNKIKFVFKDGSKYAPNEHGFYASLVVVGITNGISTCKQKVGSGWKDALKLNELGQQWQLNFPDDVGSANPRLAFDIECFDVDEKSYGQYTVDFPCDGLCGDYTTASATKM